MINHRELPIRLDFAYHHRLCHVVVAKHFHLVTRRRFDPAADHSLAYCVDVGRSRLLDRLHPHVEQDVGGFHWVVGDAFGVLGVVVPLGNELPVLRRVDRLEIAPRSEMADQRPGVDSREFFFADREGGLEE